MGQSTATPRQYRLRCRSFSVLFVAAAAVHMWLASPGRHLSTRRSQHVGARLDLRFKSGRP